jgi:hypothetical protein
MVELLLPTSDGRHDGGGPRHRQLVHHLAADHSLSVIIIEHDINPSGS